MAASATDRPAQLRPSQGRVPPHDLDAEAAVLSAVMLKPDAFDRVQPFLNPDHFYADSNRLIYEAIVALKTGNQPTDLVTIAGHLRDHGYLARVGGSPYLAQIIDATPATAYVENHATSIVEKWRVRQVIATCQAAAAEGFGGVPEVQQYIESVESMISQLAQQSRQRGLELVGDIFGRELVDIGEAQERGGAASGIPTGFQSLDRLTGGWHDGELTLLAARPGIGKTSLLTTFASSLARPQIGVAIFSLEMPREQLALRIACSEANVDMTLVRMNVLSSDALERLRAVQARLREMPIWIDDTPAITVLEMRSRVRKLKREIQTGSVPVPCKRLGLVAVDYLQLMHGVRAKGDSRELEVSSISQGLKNFAKADEVPCLALSQLNRSIENRPVKDRRPLLSDLRESGSLEQDADNVMFLFREGFYDRSIDKNDTELIVAKQRNGPTKTVRLFFKATTTRFVAHADDDESGYDHSADDEYYEDQ